MLRKVKVENGLIRGLPAADPRVTVFKGVPFAAPPVGQNRWRAPQPAQNWEGTLEAFEFAPISMQATPGLNKDDFYAREWHVDPDIPMNEDNLYLNIWTPASSKDEKLPVYVWIFGGAFQFGYTSEMEFDGERLARRNAVIVTVNYRLNSFGFLAHPEITAEAPDAPTNFGLLDQKAGIEWVKRNIAAFGGNPDNITIGGQSAGGGSVMHHLTAAENEGLFKKAVVLSGIFANVYGSKGIPGSGRTLSQVEDEGAKFFDFLGVSTLAEARELDAEKLRQKALEYKAFWGPVIDKQYVMGDALDLFIKNKHLNIPILSGHTSSEFYSKPDVSSLNEFEEMAVETFGSDADEYLNLCNFESGNLDEIQQNASIRMIEFAIRVAGETNSNNDFNTPLYYYNFDAEIPGWDKPGTFHSADLWFFFETLAKGWRPFTGKHYDLARQMSNYLANFISSGDPNGKDTNGEEMSEWEPYTTNAPYGMGFGDKAEFVKEQPDDLMKFLVKQRLKKN